MDNHDDKSHNIFTLARNGSGVPTRNWKQLSLKKKTKRYNAVFNQAEGEQLLKQLSTEGTYILNLDDNKSIQIEFGQLVERSTVFLPNERNNSVSEGWWPGTMEDGFTMKQWYRLRNIQIVLHEKTLEDIRKHLGIRIDMLKDYLHSIVFLTSLNEYTPHVSYNPDNRQVCFQLRGNIPAVEHRVTLILGEGEEAITKLMVDLPAKQYFYHVDSPFRPTRLGYELFTKTEEGKWVLIASHEATLIRNISLSMGIVTGRLKVVHGESEETYDIISHENSNVEMPLEDESEQQPWIQAEFERIQKNRDGLLEELGSIFVRFDGSHSQKNIIDIIKSNIYDPEDKYLYLWDPYIDGTIISDLLIQALRKPRIEIKLLLSENPSNKHLEKRDLEKDNNEIGTKISIEKFPCCNSIINSFIEQKKELSIDNFKARNWYSSGNHVFHDRFLITSRGVWQLGSSLKDLGKYHTTIYRLDGKLPEQVRYEFERAWNGDFQPKKPSGFELLPELLSFPRKERN